MHYSFRSTDHVAMVRFKFQLTNVENEYLLTMENKRKHTKNKLQFLEHELNMILKMILKMKLSTDFLAMSLSYVRYTLSNPAKKFDHISLLV